MLRDMDERVNKAKPVDLPAPPAARRAAIKREKARQTREWRQERREAGWPETRQVDGALAEAISFSLQPDYSISDGSEIHVSIERIFRVAVLALMRDGAARDLAQHAIRDRLAPRDAHWRPGNVPSLVGHRDDYLPYERRGGREWEEIDRAAMKAAATPRCATE